MFKIQTFISKAAYLYEFFITDNKIDHFNHDKWNRSYYTLYIYHIFLLTYIYITYIYNFLGNNKFTKLQYWYGSNKHQGTKDIITNRIMSTSVIVEKTMKEKEIIYEKLMNILDNSDELIQSRMTNEYEINYITEVAWVYKNE